MSICDTCIKANPILSCTGAWEVGSVDPTWDGVELTYKLTNTATGYITTGLTDTVAGGLIVITFDPETDLPNHWHKLELMPVLGDNTISITIDAESGCCVEFNVVQGSVETITFSTLDCNGN